MSGPPDTPSTSTPPPPTSTTAHTRPRDGWWTALTSAARSRAGWWIVLGIVVVVGATLRLWNLDWDRGQHLHPDERHWSFVLDGIAAPDSIGEYFTTGESPLNPYSTQPTFVYGTLPLFTTKAAAAVLESDVASPLVTALDTVGIDLRHDDGSLRFDGGFRANLIGRLLSALADSVTIVLVGCLGRVLAGRTAGLFAAGCYALAVLPIQQSHFLGPDAFTTLFTTGAVLAAALHVRKGHLAWVLAAGALAGAAMASRVQGVLVLVPVGLAVVLANRRAPSMGGHRRWLEPLGRFAAATALAAVVFRIAQPYAFDGWWLNRVWVDDLLALRELQAGADIPPAVQWIGRTPVVYPLGQLVTWGIGPGFAVAATFGGWVLWRRREPIALLPAATIASFVVLVATTWTPTLRYLMPVVPMLAVPAGLGLWHLGVTARSASGLQRRTVALAAGALAAMIVVWGVAFVHGVYGHTHSRVAASEWIADNVASGSTLSVDAWDDGLPLGLAGMPAYQYEQLHPFAPDTPEKIEQLVDQLGRIDLVVVSSQRARSSVERLPARYPSMLRYYDALADGSLGFERVAGFHNVPRLGPIRIDTSSAEEAFSVYDHPPVDLYRRTDRFSSETARRVLDPALASTALSPPLLDGAANALLARPEERIAIADGDTFAEIFPRDGATAAVLWIVGWLLLVGAGVTWSVRLLPRSPAGAAALALVLGPLFVTVVVWSIAAWGVANLSTWLIRAVVVAFVVAGAAAGWRHRGEVVRRWNRDRAAWVTVWSVAAVAFAAVLALRMANPDLWHPSRGGEKPMELAYFTSIARSTVVPPADPWFSGGVLNYYYLGFFHLAMPARALGIAPEVAFGLGLATVAATATAIAAAVGHDVAGLAAGRWRLGRRSSVVAGVVSAAGLLVVGNLDSIRQALDGTSAPFDWWRVSRVHTGTLDVTEFPAWSFLFGDLHPHVMGMWLTGLAVLLGVALVSHARSAPSPTRHRTLLALLGIVIAMVQMTHTWDLPPVVVVIGAAVVFARVEASPATPWRRRAMLIARDLAMVGAVAWVVTVPYRRRSMVFNDGIEPAPVTTALVDQLVHLGVWWAIAASFAGLVLLERGSPRWRRLVSGHSRWSAVGGLLTGLGVAAIVVGLGLAVSWVLGVSLALVVALAIALATAARAGRLDPALALTGGLLAAGVGLAAIPELVIVAPDIERLNTVFKLTSEAWHLLALASGPAVVLIASRLRGRPVRALGAGAAAAALVATLAFPVQAVRPRLADRPVTTTGLTLDGLAHLTGGWTAGAPNGAPIVPADDLALVGWLRREVSGQPAVVEMVGPAYGWNARISVLTGLPTVIGWPWHQTQQRLGFTAAVNGRYADVERLYTTADPDFAAFFLRAHRVRYIVVGTVELAMADPAALAVLESLPGAEVAFRDGDYRIIALDQSTLATAVAERPTRARSD